MSELPRGWEWATLYEVASWGSGGTPKRTNARFYDGEIPWAVIGDLNDGVVNVTAASITAEGFSQSSAKLVEPGTVLLAMYGSIGKLGIAGVRMATNQAIAFAQPRSELLDGRYLFWYLLSQRALLASAGKGATQRNISQAVLRHWPIPVPPMPEQERIVAAIEEFLSRRDAARAAAESARRRLSGLLDAVLHTNFDAAWPRVPLDSVNDATRPICYGILKPKTAEPGVVPYVEVRSIVEGRINVGALHRTTAALHSEFKRSELLAGDVTLAIRGSFDRAAVVPEELTGANVSRDVARIAPRPELKPDFLAAFLVSPEARRFFRAHARGVAVQGINIGDLRRLPVPIPDLDEQSAALRRIDNARSGIGRIQAEISAAETRSRALRRSILSAAFEGRLVPQDPDDEAASALLGRIRDERAARPMPTRHRGRKAS